MAAAAGTSAAGATVWQRSGTSKTDHAWMAVGTAYVVSAWTVRHNGLPRVAAGPGSGILVEFGWSGPGRGRACWGGAGTGVRFFVVRPAWSGLHGADVVGELWLDEVWGDATVCVSEGLLLAGHAVNQPRGWSSFL